MGKPIRDQEAWKDRQREREQRWRRHLAAWRQRGTTQAEYCRAHGLAPADFSWWKHELARRDAVARCGSTPRAPASFVPVQVVARNAESPVCEVVLRNGRRLRIGTECEPEWIAKVAAVLEAAGPC
jgi:hypothetical protein